MFQVISLSLFSLDHLILDFPVILVEVDTESAGVRRNRRNITEVWGMVIEYIYKKILKKTRERGLGEDGSWGDDCGREDEKISLHKDTQLLEVMKNSNSNGG